MEEEAKKSDETLASTITKLAVTSKEADNILKKVKVFESKCMNNEVTIEEYDKNLRQTTKMASDNEQKLDELTRKLGVQEIKVATSLNRFLFLIVLLCTNTVSSKFPSNGSFLHAPILVFLISSYRNFLKGLIINFKNLIIAVLCPKMRLLYKIRENFIATK